MSSRIEDKRPVKCESPDILGVIQVVGVGIVCRGRIVERRELGGNVVDRDAVAGHSRREGRLIASVSIEPVQEYHCIEHANEAPCVCPWSSSPFEVELLLLKIRDKLGVCIVCFRRNLGIR